MFSAESRGSVFMRLSCWVLAIGGSLLWLFFLNGSEPERAWRAMLINFLFFTSLSGGLVVWPAVVRQCNGRWHARVEPLAAAGIVFAVPSIAALLLLWIGSPRWAPWYAAEYHQGAWLNNSFLFGRNLTGLILFWGVALRYLLNRRAGKEGTSGGWLIMVYCLIFSLLGFDLVMALDPEWHTTLAGGYFFISGLYIALAGWALLAVWRREAQQEELQDLARLIVGFSLMTTYLMYAHLLPMWYENLPAEVRFLVPRMNSGSWGPVSHALLAVVYFGPLILLLTERAKRNRWSLGSISLVVLAGMWVERWWLVAPTFEAVARVGAMEFSLAAAFTGMLGIGMERAWRLFPEGMSEPAKPD